jgi:voltage-gated potassium channel Kch
VSKAASLDEQDLQPAQLSEAKALTPFEVFVFVLTIYSLINSILVLFLLRYDDLKEVVIIVDGMLCIVFLADFALRLHRASSKKHYLVNDLGWLDFIGSLPIPGFRFARLFRVVRTARAAGRQGSRALLRSAAADVAGSSLLVALLATVIVIQYGSMAILRAEDGVDGANIKSASDALWWSYVSITTVGYGDRYPVTNLGRWIGAAVLTVGVGLFGILTGFLANFFLTPRRSRRESKTNPNAELLNQIAELRRLIESGQSSSDVSQRNAAESAVAKAASSAEEIGDRERN